VGWGEEVYEPERERALRSVDVVLGEPAAVESGEVECSEGLGPFADICRCELVPPGNRNLSADGFSVSVMPPCAAIPFAWLRIDVKRMEDGSARAWSCHTGATDVLGRPDLCLEAHKPVCAESGTLTIERFPETQEELDGMPIELSVSLDDGRTMELRF
jgi:hypothetical protein